MKYSVIKQDPIEIQDGIVYSDEEIVSGNNLQEMIKIADEELCNISGNSASWIQIISYDKSLDMRFTNNNGNQQVNILSA